jgi:D-alanine-D-alanine ligase
MVTQDGKPAEKKVHVGVLFGGRSGEHEVSLASARSIMDNISRDKYEVVPIGITKDGEWIVGGDPMKALASGLTAESSPAALLADPSRGGVWNIDATAEEKALQTSEPEITAVRLAKLDVVFPVLHGTFGEDGTVQGLLELASVPYVGCGVMASAVAMDKAICKEIWRAQGLPVLPFLVIKRKAWKQTPAKVIDRILSSLDFPIFVKPANLGSSVGVSKVHDETELAPALDAAARYDRKIVVEQGIDAREIEVSVLGNDDPIASIAGEVIPCREFYDYRAKYIDDDSELLIPAPLNEEMMDQVRQMAVTAYKALDCAGMARADFLLDKVTGELWVNELNTIPGFTQISMYPKLWEATGISYSELISRLIDLAVERFDDQNQSERSFNVETDE